MPDPRAPHPLDDLREIAVGLGREVLRGVLTTGARAAARAYDSVLEDGEKVLKGAADAVGRRRSRVRGAADRVPDR